MKILLSILFAALLIGAPIGTGHAYAAPFSADDKKAMVLFVAKANVEERDLMLLISGVHPETGELSSRKGVNLLIGKGTPLFGPHTQSYEGLTNDDRIAVQHVKMKPGRYVVTSGHSFGQSTAHRFGCFDRGAPLIEVEAGRLYVVSLPNGRALSEEGIEDWALDAELTPEQLRDVIERYSEANRKRVGTETPAYLEEDLVTFPARVKGKRCIVTDPKQYERLPR